MMAIVWSKIRPHKYVRVLAQNPQLLTCNPYVNFLRNYKAQHPRLGLRKLLENGCTIWSNLSSPERRRFNQKKVGGIRPRLKWTARPRMSKIPRHRMPRSNIRRKLKTTKNTQRRKKLNRALRRYRPKRPPKHYV